MKDEASKSRRIEEGAKARERPEDPRAVLDPEVFVPFVAFDILSYESEKEGFSHPQSFRGEVAIEYETQINRDISRVGSVEPAKLEVN